MRALALALATLGAACVTEIPVHRMEPSSFKVDVLCAGADPGECPPVTAGMATCSTVPAPGSPANFGTPDGPVPPEQLFYEAQVTAIGSNGEPYPGYSGTASVYVMFDGNTTPRRNALTAPLATLPFTGGKACLAVTIPPAFNQTALWVEDSGLKLNSGSHAIGASKPIYRPSPLISDVQRTTDPQTTSPLNEKHVLIKGGTDGKPIVVTAVFAQAFMVTDLGTPGEGQPWGSLDVYSYSQPTVKVGQTVKNLNGTLSEFHGLTELNFPIWDMDDPTVDPARVPAPHLIQPADVADTLGKMEPFESGLVEFDQWKVCDVFDGHANKYDLQGWTKYTQWKIAPPSAIASDGTCADSTTSVSVTSNVTAPAFHPEQEVGKTVCKLDGILSQVIPAPSISLWAVTPRTEDAHDLNPEGVVEHASDCP